MRREQIQERKQEWRKQEEEGRRLNEVRTLKQKAVKSHIKICVQQLCEVTGRPIVLGSLPPPVLEQNLCE